MSSPEIDIFIFLQRVLYVVNIDVDHDLSFDLDFDHVLNLDTNLNLGFRFGNHVCIICLSCKPNKPYSGVIPCVPPKTFTFFIFWIALSKIKR